MGIDRSQASPGAHPVFAGEQSHDATQRPFEHAAPAAQTMPSHGSTQPRPRHRCPAGHRTFASQSGTHVFASSHVEPGGQP
jgi:hypothetical protein